MGTQHPAIQSGPTASSTPAARLMRCNVAQQRNGPRRTQHSRRKSESGVSSQGQGPGWFRQCRPVRFPAQRHSHRTALPSFARRGQKGVGLACRQASDSSVVPQLTGSQDPLHACVEVGGQWVLALSIVVVLCHVVGPLGGMR